jgi:ectoine hydroxylase-related dioxygenase (phytanoyl-CoA dioxygenase family)
MEKQLKNKQTFHFDNEKWCEQNLSDRFIGGHIQWNLMFGFSIFFNGACIHTSKTFKSSKKRLDKLMSDWNCEFKPL